MDFSLPTLSFSAGVSGQYPNPQTVAGTLQFPLAPDYHEKLQHNLVATHYINGDCPASKLHRAMFTHWWLVGIQFIQKSRRPPED